MDETAKTSKEVFDEVTEQVEENKKKNNEATDTDNFEDEEVSEEVEDEVVDEDEAVEEETLKTLSQVNSKNSLHLPSEKIKVINDLQKLHEAKKVADPVTSHLLSARKKLFSDLQVKQQQAKKLYMSLVREVGIISQEVLKIQGAIESVDKQVLEVLEKDRTQNVQ